MGVGENASLLCQPIHMRRQRLRVASEETRPVIEIVDANHQDVRPARILRLRF